MYAFVWKNGHVIWREWRYTFKLDFLLQINLYMIQEDHVFVVNGGGYEFDAGDDGFECH
jgi:hypothetical protein